MAFALVMLKSSFARKSAGGNGGRPQIVSRMAIIRLKSSFAVEKSDGVPPPIKK